MLLAPVISEKSYGLLDENKYTFDVHPDANKTQIKIAVEKVFNVKVTDVNTLNRQGKRKRTRLGYGTAQGVKRAIVTLRAGDRIDVFGQIWLDRQWLFVSTSRRPRGVAARRVADFAEVTRDRARRSRWSARCTTRAAATTPARSRPGTRAAVTSAPTG